MKKDIYFFLAHIDDFEISCFSKKLNATAYLSGISGKNYLDEDIFLKNNIKVLYQDFIYPTYFQDVECFISNLSILDLIFSVEPSSAYDIIKSGYTVKV